MTPQTDDADLRDILARLHVARWSGILPPDLGDAVIDLLTRQISRAQQRHDRDRWLRRAGSRFSGSSWVKAGFVHSELTAQSRQRFPECFDPDRDWRGCVRAALHVDPRVPSQKQIARILDAPE